MLLIVYVNKNPKALFTNVNMSYQGSEMLGPFRRNRNVMKGNRIGLDVKGFKGYWLSCFYTMRSWYAFVNKNRFLEVFLRISIISLFDLLCLFFLYY